MKTAANETVGQKFLKELESRLGAFDRELNSFGGCNPRGKMDASLFEIVVYLPDGSEFFAVKDRGFEVTGIYWVKITSSIDEAAKSVAQTVQAVKESISAALAEMPVPEGVEMPWVQEGWTMAIWMLNKIGPISQESCLDVLLCESLCK